MNRAGGDPWRLRLPVSLKFTLPLILLAFAAVLSTGNLLVHVPQAEQAVQEDSRKRLTQELSRLQSTLEYLLLKGDAASAQHEIEVLAHNHDLVVAALADEQGRVMAATRRTWLGQPIGQMLPELGVEPTAAAQSLREHRAGISLGPRGDSLVGHAGILLGGERDQLRPSRRGSLLLVVDLARYKAEARAQVLQQSVYWAGWVTALALALWAVFHFLLTRRTARLVHAAERFAAGDLGARSGLAGNDELARLGRAFDAMAKEVAHTQQRLRDDIAEHARVQRELEQSEARLKQILDNAPAVVSLRDTQGRFLFVNPQWQRVFGIDTSHIIGRVDHPRFGDEYASDMRRSDAEVIERDEAMQFEVKVQRRDGEHTYLASKFPLHDASGAIYAVCVISTEITERKRADEALRASEASYRAIFDASEDAIFVHDLETAAIVDANQKACTTWGYSREEFRQLQIGQLGTGVEPYAQEDAMRLFARAVAGERMHIDWHARYRDGTLRWHEVFGKRVTIGGRDRVLALARDITERKQAEQALAASEEQYRAMFDASIDGLVLWNADGDVVDANPALWRIYGLPGGDFAALRPGGCTRCDYPVDFLRRVAAGESLHREASATLPDGSRLELEVHGVPMVYQGRPHVLTIARDVTEKKRSAAELARERESSYRREKLAALGSLLAGVAHELNNPLSVVVARAVLLEEQANPATRGAAAKIRSAAERCARIVRTFLAMARQQPPRREPVAIDEVIAAALEIAGYTMRSNGIAVQFDRAGGLPLVMADADQLHQVLLNLLINAQQALQDRDGPRRIRIASCFDTAASLLRITVADNGPGIAEPLRARVFEPYFTTKPTGLGTGVGLAVSLGIVEAHGGTLTVERADEGGAAFTFALPVTAVDAASEVPLQAAALQAHARTILVVDDEADVRETLAEILTRAHHHVVAAASGREALDRIAARRYDVVFADMRMPDLDGRALYREIERRWPAQAERVVFVTGDMLTATLREFVAASGRPLIEKPFLPSDVRRVVGELAAAG
jgi:PAS domain S-box-containing protein